MKPSEMFDGVKIVASVSGGKDSVAMCLYMKERGIEYIPAFVDVGWEHPDTIEYIHDVLDDTIGPIRILPMEPSLPKQIYEMAMFPQRGLRYCSEAKAMTMRRFIHSLEPPVINAVGIRAGESLSRTQVVGFSYDEGVGVDVWRPLINWTFRDVIDAHNRHGIPPNPLYLRGHTRVGCWPCIMASKSEIKLVADEDPERINRIREMEAHVKKITIERYAKKGTTLEAENHDPPTFFQRKGRRGGKGGVMTPIDTVVAWARQTKGAPSMELMDPDAAGCMRWGMCEHTRTEDWTRGSEDD